MTVAALVGGAATGLVSFASAQTADTTTTSATTQAAPPQGQFDPRKGGHVGSNGTKEELLTGDTAAKVTAAALAAQPGATIERVETDADGAVYEAHMTKADGTRITVLFDASYNVTGTETGHGGPK